MILESNNEFISTFKKLIATSDNIEMSTGYFSTSIFEIFYDEFEQFRFENGSLRIIIGADTNINELDLLKKIEFLSQSAACDAIAEYYFSDLKSLTNDTLLLILNLFKNNNIEIKIGFSESGGIYHSKYYTFKNEVKSSVIMGSLNLTSNGLFNNYEMVYLFENSDEYIGHLNSFNKIWNNVSPNARCESLSNIVISKVNSELEIRGIQISDATKDNIQLRDYQEEAIASLLDNDMNGFLKMATGTGKTFTSIYALKKYKEKSGSNLNIHIVVPYIHLATQWMESIKDVFPDASILECHTSKSIWIEQFNNTRYQSMTTDCFSVFVKDSYINNIDTIRYSISSDTILVSDEAHNLNLENLEELQELNYQHKVGLSATPEHYMFEERTSKLFEYFKGCFFVYDLKDAIDNNYLTKYNYYPTIVNLNNEEIDAYKKLDIKIKSNGDRNEILNLLEERNYLLSSATGKIIKLKEILQTQELDMSLVYCNPGKVRGTNLSYIEYIAEAIKEVRPRERLEKITASESKEERVKIVKRLENGAIDGILAIRCLDEGFDIPVIKDAYILSSTQNPKEFIQRRGRVLRKYPGKKITNIYDFVVAINGVILEAEQLRINEYSSLASNKTYLEKFKEINNWE